MTAIAGLDIATTTGLAILEDGQVRTQTWRGTPKKAFLETSRFGSLDPMKEGDIGWRFMRFLEVWLEENAIEAVAIEAPLPTQQKRVQEEITPDAIFAGQSVRRVVHDSTNIAAGYRAMGLSMIAVSICRGWNLPVYMVAQQTWRKEFLGNGRPKEAKQEARKQCEKMGIAVSSLDAAEAVGIVTWLDRTLRPSEAQRRANELFSSPAASG